MEVHYGDGDILYQQVTPTGVDKGTYYGTVLVPHTNYPMRLDNPQLLVFALCEDGPWYVADAFMVRTRIEVVPRYDNSQHWDNGSE